MGEALRQQNLGLLLYQELVMLRGDFRVNSLTTPTDTSDCNVDIAFAGEELNALTALQALRAPTDKDKARLWTFVKDMEDLRIMFSAATIKRDAYREDLSSGYTQDVALSSTFLASILKRDAVLGQTLKSKIEQHALSDNVVSALKVLDSIDAVVPSDEECGVLAKMVASQGTSSSMNDALSKYDDCRHMEAWALLDLTAH